MPATMTSHTSPPTLPYHLSRLFPLPPSLIPPSPTHPALRSYRVRARARGEGKGEGGGRERTEGRGRGRRAGERVPAEGGTLGRDNSLFFQVRVIGRSAAFPSSLSRRRRALAAVLGSPYRRGNFLEEGFYCETQRLPGSFFCCFKSVLLVYLLICLSMLSSVPSLLPFVDILRSIALYSYRLNESPKDTHEEKRKKTYTPSYINQLTQSLDT